MPQSYHKIWLHLIWSTKDRQPLMRKGIRRKIYAHILEHAARNDINVDTINGIPDHLHCLIGLHPTQSPAKVVNLLKGESSNWINKNNFLNTKFAWQDGYGVFSIGTSQVPRIRRYILQQPEHHKKVTYQEEVQKFLKAYGLEE